ncbi:MAG: Uma2 family endonuclease, partial [Flammeovirgaceae bacterium]
MRNTRKPLVINGKNHFTVEGYLAFENASIEKHADSEGSIYQMGERESISLDEPKAEYQKKYFTVEEYLRLERASTQKHEYFQGEIFALAGASLKHNKIFSNVFGELAARLKGNPCQLFGSDMR